MMAEKQDPESLPLSPGMVSRGERLRVVEGPGEGRLFMTIVKAVIAVNTFIFLVNISAQWGFWDIVISQPSKSPRLQHDIIDLSHSYPRLRGGTHKVNHWVQMTRRQAPPVGNASTLPLQTFSVDVPLLDSGGRVVGAGTPDGFEGIETTVDSAAASCQVTLAVNVFANSFGSPFVGNYTPPDCLGNSNTVVMNLTVQSRGRQFDRLGIVYLGDYEILRTSTEEPRAQGISYTYMKDMSHLMALWKQPQKVIFDLPNIVDPTLTPPLTGTFNTTLTASFFNAPQALTPANTIIPISARQSNNNSRPSVFTIPNENNSTASTIVTDFPRNAARAIFTVSATGQANEEFWWTNVLESAVETYKAAANATLFGFSPFREVQVFIDGQLAGVQWPFPVIFTGGVVPSLWNPMVGIDAFDLKEGEIDISPWLGVLCDGNPHNFSINVVGLNDNGGTTAVLSSGVDSNWQLTGKIFVWLDSDPNAITTGPAPTIDGLQPTIAVTQAVTQNATGFNDTLHYTTSVKRTFSVSSSITTSSGTKALSWTQGLSHSDDGLLSNAGGNQLNNITTEGTDTSTFPDAGFTHTYSYPLSSNVTSELLSNGTTRIAAVLSRTKSIDRSVGSGGDGSVSPSGLQLFAALPATANLVGGMTGISLSTTQSGSAFLLIPPNGTTSGFGDGQQRLRFGGGSGQALGDEVDLELYLRDISLDGSGKVFQDTETLVGSDITTKRPLATGPGGSGPG
ncbi:hypothetical protein N0V93_002397 [Gnomoniopsis smithogilvyi]|uniref:Peptide N-acetyl-beta-D-glucosaminyl asparaginase amidase A N-terminal domain-containing protein n=1 Tax=Gnomoniopsis smithogilvyi TaxID=1191159 RepID=A0A9W8YWD9_9PEZI|nr:hypothetical protein N0V93_002397 [Gnomoniopsis smithogilvyi]